MQDVSSLLKQHIAADEPLAEALASCWLIMVERDTAHNTDFINRLNQMHIAEPGIQEKTGITPDMMDYIILAFSYSKLAIYRRYLNDEEYIFTAAHYFDHIMDWRPLVAAIRQAVDKHCSPESMKARGWVEQWLALFSSCRR